MTRPGGVYNAADTIALTLNQIEVRRIALLENRAVSGFFGIAELDNYLVPLWPGDLMYVTALPSNGKSFTCRMMEKRVVDLLLANDDGSRVAAWVTTEESVEKIGAHWLAGMSGVSSTAMLSGKLSEAQQVTTNAKVAAVGSWPLYVIGHSGAVRDDMGIQHKAMRLSRDDIDACFDYILNKLKKDVVLATVDYVHRVRNAGRGDREEHIRRTVDWTRDLATWLNAPVVAAAQAKAKIGERKHAMPGIPDVEWSMNAGQSADAMLGLWMPKSTLGVGALIENFGGFKNIAVEEDMMFVAVAKQKDGPAGRVFLLRVKPHMLKWELLDMKTTELNPQPEKKAYDPRDHYGGGKEHGAWPGSGTQETIKF